ncbi:putative fatty acyl-CoA reductase CG5065 [Colletes gigas]|uniref:putative fatty acyl-CoA reductase CG5065 n=1 Tax=Colletes gigas TaxID=935657 RepID=UPI001C9A4CCD|nr:putative fatty acyl-CoA reductase CG5065 [Colletes gigas]
MESKITSVAEWYRGRNIFITGGTGFMGKVLIYKLMLSCPDLGNVFVLIRKKRGVEPQARLQRILQEEPLKTINEKYPERLKKLILVSGDTIDDDLTLSTADKERLLREVSVVFHMAANVKFDLTLKEAVTMNVMGTQNVVNLVKEMPHLVSFIHVSTAYSQCTEPVLEERYYECSEQPEVVINTVKNLTDDVLHAMTPKILHGQPNTYAYSKALSENVVQKSNLPAGIVRPSIVVGSLKEPVVGWVDNINGPMGLMIGGGKGVIRIMLCDYDCLLNIIPCDMAINAMITFARKIGMEKPKMPIYMNVASGSENPLSWGYAIESGIKWTRKNPFSGLLWYPNGSLTSLKLYFWVCVILFHLLPAYIIDTIITLTGNKPFLVKVQYKINAAIKLMYYYTTKDWHFRNDRMKQLQLELNPSDREVFFMDTAVISWDDFICIYLLGAREYFLKDDPSTLPRARKILNYLYYADTFVKTIFTIFVVWIVYSYLSPYKELTATTFDVHEI